ncbi:SpoIIE family protein phosphatase [Streptomyces sp. NBC_01262]|uniref:SpoIIE family protein phosphatase n=1 Tax=Streptomyces sp. NBC_01262 TaxID=2903803 RepID=UPI002E336529|nr:SpoIIE family protein phosphatase [Streptomyces sp. NBC_01262]
MRTHDLGARVGEAGQAKQPKREPDDVAAAPGGLLDVLRIAAFVLDDGGRITLWSPEAERMFGYAADEVLGRSGAMLVAPENLHRVVELFEQVTAGEPWAGVFPVRLKDGSTRQLEFRNMRMDDVEGRIYALGMGVNVSTVRSVETDLAISASLVEQSPIGVAVFDTDLRLVRANRAEEQITGIAAADMLGLSVSEIAPGVDSDAVENALRQVLETGRPLIDQQLVGRTRADPETDHAWSVSFHRLEDPSGKILGLAASAVDISERVRQTNEVAEARGRLAVIAEAGTRIGTTLDLTQTARELADVVVPRLADMAAVDVLDSVINGRSSSDSVMAADGSAQFRALAVAAGNDADGISAADPIGELASYGPTRLITKSVREGQSVLVRQVDSRTMRRIARNEEAAEVLLASGAHSYLAAPLIARGDVLGTLSLFRTHNPRPFSDEDRTLACELAARAAISIDNARLYAAERETALALQRSLLPQQPPEIDGMEIAFRYLPAVSEVGGDWFDVLPLKDGKVGLIVGDVMGKGVQAAAIMGQLRTATRAFAQLGLAPDELLHHLDDIPVTLGGESIATCVYAVCDPRTGHCVFSSAGHLPPVLIPPDGHARLLDIPVGAPLGVGGVPFHTVEHTLEEGALLAFFTDGLVEDRRRDIDVGLSTLLALLEGDHRPLEQTCDLVLDALHHAPDDDVALLLARLRRTA